MTIDKIIAIIPSKSDAQRRKMRENADRWLSSGTEPQKAQARRLVDALDAQGAAEHQQRHDEVTAMTLSERVVEAFRRRPPTPSEEKAIDALLAHPGATSRQLSAACGWKGQIWHTRFGTMCKNREADLWPAEPSTARDANFYVGILTTFDPDGDRFTMKPEVVEGFAELGISAPARRSAHRT
jgi:hypothetical protein